MRYLSLGLEKGSIIVEVDTCGRCFAWRRDAWWKASLWQHPLTGKVHQVDLYRDRRTECGVKIPTAAQVVDRHIAVSVS